MSISRLSDHGLRCEYLDVGFCKRSMHRRDVGLVENRHRRYERQRSLSQITAKSQSAMLAGGNKTANEPPMGPPLDTSMAWYLTCMSSHMSDGMPNGMPNDTTCLNSMSDHMSNMSDHMLDHKSDHVSSHMFDHSEH